MASEARTGLPAERVEFTLAAAEVAPRLFRQKSPIDVEPDQGDDRQPAGSASRNAMILGGAAVAIEQFREIFRGPVDAAPKRALSVLPVPRTLQRPTVVKNTFLP